MSNRQVNADHRTGKVSINALEDRIARAAPLDGSGPVFDNPDNLGNSVREGQGGINFGYAGGLPLANVLMTDDGALITRLWNSDSEEWDSVSAHYPASESDGVVLFTGGAVQGARAHGTVQGFAYEANHTPSGKYQGVSMTLTGNVAIAAPTVGVSGQELIFVLTQDATGGRVATFASAYKKVSTLPTAANTRNVIVFLHIGSGVWVEKSCTTAIPV